MDTPREVNLRKGGVIYGYLTLSIPAQHPVHNVERMLGAVGVCDDAEFPVWQKGSSPCPEVPSVERTPPVSPVGQN